MRLPDSDQVRRRACTRRSECVLAGIALQERHELARGPGRKRWGADENVRRATREGDRCEIFLRDVRNFLQQRRNGDRPARRGENGVAVWRRLGGLTGADGASGPSAVVGDDLLAEEFRQTLRDHAADEIGGLSRWPGHDHADRVG